MSGRNNLIAAGFALTALSYGLARFVYGLLLPQIRADLSLSATAAGWIGGSAFAAYCVGIIFTFLVGDRAGPRALLIGAGATATVGMALVALSPNAWVLSIAIALAGVSTGLTSPPLASAVAQQIDDESRPQANAVINSGTAAAIVFSGLAAMTVAGAWRELYGLFVLIGGAVTLWLWRVMPAASAARSPRGLSLTLLTRPGLPGLCLNALLMGASSTAVWTFGAGILRDALDFGPTRIALAWVILGASGLFGSATGLLTARYGVGRVERRALFGMAIGIAGLAAASEAPVLAFAAMGLFGAAYIISTGALLIRGVAGLPDRPDLGLGVPFLAVAIGQTVGAPLFGAILDRVGSGPALLCFAAIACGAMLWSADDPVAAFARTGIPAKP